MRKLILALDQGTSSSRALIFDDTGLLVASHAFPVDCLYPQPGWVEQNADELWQTQKLAVTQVLANARINAAEITALGISNQRETVIAWDKRSGRPLYNAIVWQCRRSADYCQTLKSSGYENEISARTGLIADPYFSATKMRWLLENIAAVREAANQGQLAFGTVDSWLMWNLSAGRLHVTDVSNASRTLLFNIHQLQWDDVLLEKFGIPRETLPTVCDSSAILGYCEPTLFGAALAIAGVAGDQQAALFGQCCFDAGMSKNTYGTGGFMLMNTGLKPVASQHGLLSTVAWKIKGQTHYALEGSVFMAGALIQWLRDQMGLLHSAAESDTLAQSLDNNGGVYIVPAFVGLGAPYWDSAARGLICGLTRGSTRAHIARAALEAVAYQTHDVLRSMQQDTGLILPELRIDGGMSVNQFLCQFQADILRCPVSRPAVIESSALGAAYLAGLATDIWPSTEHIARQWQEAQRFKAQMPPEQAQDLLSGWSQALARARL